MFDKTLIKLTGLYLVIIMVISLFFSASIYQISIAEFDRSIRGPGRMIDRELEISLPLRLRNQIVEQREEQYTLAQQRILGRLLFINSMILLGGGILSYILANKTLKPIQKAHESLERFTADASHELRTPLAVMLSENEVALMDPKLTLAQSKKQLSSNIEEIEKLTALSEGLLQLASQDSLEKKNVSAKTLTEDAIAGANGIVKSKNIAIKSDVDKSLEVNVDQTGMTQVLSILITNAAKYSPAKSEVIIRAHKHGKSAQFEVSDKGVGIKASDIPHIFDRFYRADSSRTKGETDGYGLGLAIAKDIVERHGGTISATSRPNKGSVFTIKLTD